jgi:hypothetical protein
MGKGKRDVELDALVDESAFEYAQRIRKHFADKAEHNKLESLGFFVLTIVATLTISVFIAFGDSLLTGKIVPVCLSLIATAASTWLQFRKPHQLWAIYRSAQRYIESNLVHYRFEIDEFARAKDKDKLLAKQVAQIALAAHELWVPLIPSPEGLDKLRSTPTTQLVARPGELAKNDAHTASP